jgi:hypothetical protein
MADNRRIAPIVSDADRQWAIEQKPDWWDAKALERAQRLNPKNPVPLDWTEHVWDQAERFEAHWEHQTDRKPPAEWSGLWRRVWWPKADPRIRYPESAPYEHDGEHHPFFKRGDPRFEEALRVATPAERELWSRFGVAQFQPGDKRAERILRGQLT